MSADISNATAARSPGVIAANAARCSCAASAVVSLVGVRLPVTLPPPLVLGRQLDQVADQDLTPRA
ncbi:MAG: hypothetical protein ACFCVK_04535 [Acidimicrobiales bacterium]